MTLQLQGAENEGCVVPPSVDLKVGQRMMGGQVSPNNLPHLYIYMYESRYIGIGGKHTVGIERPCVGRKRDKLFDLALFGTSLEG